jgi:hypothetical protein
MTNLPKDPIMLLSVINTQLRDNYASLDKLCDEKNVDKNELTAKLESIGYRYDEALNQFR